MVAKNKSKSATVKATKAVKPKRPKVDRGQEIEQLVRQMFKTTVDLWCKNELDETPSKEVRGNVVDNLTASFTSGIETIVDAATDSYLSTFADDDEDDEEEGDEDEEEDDEEEDDEDDEDEDD